MVVRNIIFGLFALLFAGQAVAIPPGIHVPHKKIGACTGNKFPYAAAKAAGVAITAVTDVTTLMGLTPRLPADWVEQRKMLGFRYGAV